MAKVVIAIVLIGLILAICIDDTIGNAVKNGLISKSVTYTTCDGSLLNKDGVKCFNPWVKVIMVERFMFCECQECGRVITNTKCRNIKEFKVLLYLADIKDKDSHRR